LISGSERADRLCLFDLAFQGEPGYPAVVAMRDGPHKFILHRTIQSPYIREHSGRFSGRDVELYQILKDPRERQNLIKQGNYRDLCFSFLKQTEEYIESFKEMKKIDEMSPDKSLLERLKALGYIK
jgi:hypothetical protein